MESREPEGGAPGWSIDFALASDRGTERGDNEDACGFYVEAPTHVLVGVADGVSGEHGGEVASQTAIDVTLRTYKESAPSWGPLKRLYRAMQQANIEIHDLALVVPELRGMATTLTTVAIVDGTLAAAHVGDSRLYLIRGGRALQLTKDHRASPTVLTRCVGRELIAAIDRLSRPVEQGDALVLCTDGLHGVVSDEDIAACVTAEDDPERACRALVDAALARHTTDNVTAAVIRIVGPTPLRRPDPGVGARLRRFLGRSP